MHCVLSSDWVEPWCLDGLRSAIKGQRNNVFEVYLVHNCKNSSRYMKSKAPDGNQPNLI